LISFEPSFKTWCKIIIPVIKDHGSKKMQRLADSKRIWPSKFGGCIG
jgi:hypothetical protein